MHDAPESTKITPVPYGRRQADLMTPGVLGTGVLAFIMAGQNLIAPLSAKVDTMSVQMARFENVIYRVERLEKTVDNPPMCRK